MPKLLISEREAAGMFALTPAALRKWRQLGKGPRYFSISSRCVRYDPSDIERFLKERHVMPESGPRPAREV